MNTYNVKIEETHLKGLLDDGFFTRGAFEDTARMYKKYPMFSLFYEIEANSKEEAVEKLRESGSSLYAEDHDLVIIDFECDDDVEANVEEV